MLRSSPRISVLTRAQAKKDWGQNPQVFSRPCTLGSINNPPAYAQIRGSSQALPRRSEGTPYRCYLPVLAGFAGS